MMMQFDITRIIITICCILHVSHAKVGFQKDDNLEMEFPPNLVKRHSSNIPLGHLRPLGYQRKPDGKISESSTEYSPSDFWHKFVKHNLAASFRGVLKEKKDVTNLTELWTDRYLKENYGSLDIEVTMKKEMVLLRQPGFRVQKMKLSKFLKEYKYEDWYLSSLVPQPMINELRLPKMLQCSSMKKHLMEAELWMSSGGTSSTVHYHADHDLHCIIDGRKDIIFIDPIYKDKFHMKERSPKSGSGYSTLDLEMVNMFKQADIADVPWVYTSIRKGDCVFIPAGVLHQVRSYGRSVSYALHWAPIDETSFDDCKAEELKQSVSLSEASFFWTNVAGTKQLSNIRLNAESLRHHLLSLLRKDNKLYFERFNAVYKTVMATTRLPMKGQAVFKLIDPSKQGYLTREEIVELDSTKLKAVADVLNSAHKRVKDEL
ncbi:uncharacterized protein LOC141909890 [Tubulanus polymorphus]|uniref:uncharacterized protein LOC141909890 n=1 Tax=Tubulanus polymorphus TaxID=672921 RepID=UPI003DA50E58